MAFSSTSFVNGQIGNPNGRPIGSRNKRTKEIIQQIIESNNKDPGADTRLHSAILRAKLYGRKNSINTV